MALSQSPVYLLTYDHGGYILWGKHFKDRLENAIDWLVKYPSFKIGLDNEAFAYDQYARTQPEIIAYIDEKLRQYPDRLGLGSSTYGQPLSVFINEESNVRQLVYAIRTNLKYFKKTPTVFAISEHGLHSQMPQLLRQTGYKGAIMRTHFMMYGYNPTYDAAYGIWQGEDGSEIPTVPTYEGEGAAFAITTFDNWVLTRWPDQTDRSLEDFVNAFSHIRPLLASRYDDIVLRCEKLTDYVEKRKDQYRWILLEEIPDLFGEPKAKFAPTANEFVVRMPWGYCGNRIFNQCRKSEISVLTAERLNAFSVLAGGDSMQEELEESWRNLLVAQHHDIQICGLTKDSELYTGQSLVLSKKVVDTSLEHLTHMFSTGPERAVVVYNPHGFTIRQTIECEVAYPRGKGSQGFSLWFKDEEIPCEYDVLDDKDGRISRFILRFTAEVPGLSARKFTFHPDELSTRRTQLETHPSQTIQYGGYTMELDTGGIRSLEKDGVTYFKEEGGFLFAGVIDGQEKTSVGMWNVTQRGSSLTAEYAGKIGTVGISFTMGIKDGRIDCRVRFSHHGEKIGTAEEPKDFHANTNGFVHETKLRFFLPVEIDSRRCCGVRDLPFLVEETPDQYIQGNYWTACSDGTLGVACFNGGSMCMVRESKGVSIPLEYANRYVWGARMLYGEYEHTFSILPFSGSWESQDLHRKAVAYEFPLVLREAEPGQEGPWDDEIQFFSLACSGNVLLSALYPEDSKVIARFYEYAGQEGSVQLQSSLANAENEVNLLGLREACASAMGDIVPLSPHQIRSFSFTKKEGVS